MWTSLMDHALPQSVVAAFEELRREIRAPRITRTKFFLAPNSELMEQVAFVTFDEASGYGIGIWFGPGPNVTYYAKYTRN